MTWEAIRGSDWATGMLGQGLPPIPAHLTALPIPAGADAIERMADAAAEDPWAGYVEPEARKGGKGKGKGKGQKGWWYYGPPNQEQVQQQENAEEP